MTRTQKVIRYFIGLTLTIGLSGCAELLPTVPPKPAQGEYLEVEYRKFVSGVYVDELANKYVKINCTYSSTMAGTLPGGYPSQRYMSFLAVSPTYPNITAPEILNVVVPKDLADMIFALKHGDSITVYGRAVPAVYQRTLGGRSVYKSLILQADLIEKK